MEAKLNIYNDCSGEPIKTYVCKRMILKVSKKVSALVEKLNKASTEEQERITIDVIKTIFPDFKDEEFDLIFHAVLGEYRDAVGYGERGYYRLFYDRLTVGNREEL